MALTYVGAGTVAYSTGNPSPGAAANGIGDLLVLLVGTKPDTTPATTPTGWTSLGAVSGGTGTTGIDTGPMRVGVFWKIASSANETPGAVTVTGNNVSAAQIFAWSIGAGNSVDVVMTGAADTTTGTAFTATMPVDPGLTVNDELLVVGVIPTDVTTPAQFTAETVSAPGITTVTLTELIEWDTASGSDMGGFVARGPVVTGTSTGAPTISATAAGTTTNVAGPLALVRIREVTLTNVSGNDSGTFSATESSSVFASSPTNPTLVASAGTAYNTTTSPKTTTALNVAANDVLVDVSASADIWDAGGDVMTTTNSGTAQTWTKQQTVGPPLTTNCFAQASTAIQSGANASQTITDTYTSTGTPQWGHHVLQFRNSDGIGNTVKGNSGSLATGTINITTTQANSAIVVILADWNAGDGSARTWATVNGITPTAANGYEIAYGLSSTQYTWYVAYYPDAGAAGVKTVGVSSPTTQYSIVAVEVKGTSSSSTPISGNDSGTFSATETSGLTITNAISASDTGTFSVTEVANKVMTTADSGTLSATETSNLLVSPSTTDAGTFSATETSAVSVVINTTDSGTLSDTETSSLLSLSTTSDNGTFSATEASSSSSTLSATDSGAFSTTETSSVSVFNDINTNDSGTFSATETSALSVFNGIAASDTGTFSIAETASVDATGDLTDAGTLAAVEQADLLALFESSDSGALSITETASVGDVSTNTYRMYESSSPPTASANDFAPVNLGVEFYVTSNASLTEIRWWQPSTGADVSTRTAGLYSVVSGGGNTLLGSATGAPSGSGWQTITFTTPIALTAGTRYRARIYHPAGGYPATGAYYGSGSDEANGPLTIPKAANSTDGLQGQYNYVASAAYPNQAFNSTNYWIDVTVSTAGGTTNKSGSDTGTLSVTEASALQIISTSDDPGTLSAIESTSVAAALSAVDSGTLSATDASASALSSTGTDSGTFSATENSALVINVTLSANDSGTFSATEAANPVITFQQINANDNGTFSATDSSASTVTSSPTDTGTFSATETSSLAIVATLSASDSGTFSTTEVSNLQGVAAFTANDSGTFSATETSNLVKTTTTTDTGTFSITETSAIVGTGSLTDTGTFSATETAASTGTANRPDSGTFSATETATLQILTLKSAVDSGTFSVTETSASSSTLSRTDTGTFSVTETATVNKNIASSDSGTWSATETSFVASASPAADSGTLSATENAAVAITIDSSDSGILSAIEVSTRIASGNFAGTDEGTLSATEESSLYITYESLYAFGTTDEGTLYVGEEASIVKRDIDVPSPTDWLEPGMIPNSKAIPVITNKRYNVPTIKITNGGGNY